MLFARQPQAGRVKTRLMPALGAEGAAALHRRLVLQTLRTADAAARRASAVLEVWHDGGSVDALRHWLGDGWQYRAQCEGDLGQRMAAAFEASFEEGTVATVLIGSDCPSLSQDLLAAAFEALERCPVVIGPATDGGYYLIGLSRSRPELFRGLPWGTESVLARSLEVLAGLGEEPVLLPALDDVDRPEDLSAWQRIAAAEEEDLARVSVIVPALNEGAGIAACLESARQGSPHELIVVDGGSADDTVEIAKTAGATVLLSRPGRARQMNAGAARASGSVLLFLHADTVLPGGWACQVAAGLGRAGVTAGAFRFGLTEDFPGRRLVEWATNLRCRWFQMPYGDQGLFLRRSVFEELGGYRELPILEDYVLVTALRRRGRIELLPDAIRTSGRRWRRMGFVRTTVLNRLVIAGFRCGVSPARLSSWYRNPATGHGGNAAHGVK